MPRWFQRLIARFVKTGSSTPPGPNAGSKRKSSPEKFARKSSVRGPSGAVSGEGTAPGATPTTESDDFPTVVEGIGNLDMVERARAKLEERERQLLLRIGKRIVSRKFDLPQLPSTTLRVMEMAAAPEMDVPAIVDQISSDLTLSGEFLRVANSALFAGSVPTETLHDAIVRLGRRTLRSVVLSISMRGAILDNRALLHYAEEVWRQSYSVGLMARIVAKFKGIDPEHGFLLGLMHDVGKVSLLSDLSKELDKAGDLSAALVGTVFSRFHEVAGEAMARAWTLSEELCAVAGQHHKFERNEGYAESAALVSIAHKMDLYLSMGAETDYHALSRSAEMKVLGLGDTACKELLFEAMKEFRGLGREAAAA
ncbi:MAG: HDOD domain-containing protein [bacterium]|nr:HDOD domain-containing protein [bacterium]